MPLQLIRGRGVVPAPGLVVAPDGEATNRLQRLALDAGWGATGCEVMSMGALRARVRSASGVAPVEPVGRISTRMGVRAAMGRVDLSPLGAVAHAPGFVASLERAAGELREAGVDSAVLGVPDADPVSRVLAELIAATADVPMPADERWRVAAAAGALTGFPAVTLVGFDDLPPPEWALLRALAAVTSVVVVMPYADARRACEARHPRQARWAAQADAVVDAWSAPDAGRHPALTALAAAVFEDVPPPVAAAGAPVRLVGAAGTRGMHRLALQEVLDAHAQGVPLADCALVVPRLADVSDDLDRLAADWRVPIRRVTRRRIVETPLGAALIALLRLGEPEPGAPGALDEMLRWLRTPYSGALPGEVDLFEVAARRADLDERGALMGRWDGQVIAPARRMVAAARGGVPAQIAAMVEVGWQGLRCATAGGRAPTRADALDRAVLGVLGGIAWESGEDGEPEHSPQRARGPLPPGELGQVLADLTVRDESGPHDALRVHDYASIRGQRFRMVVLCGLDGDGFPARPAPDPILGRFRPRLGEAMPVRAPGTSESRMRFWQALDGATERLVLVRRLVDDDGREVAPSPYWAEACRVMGRGLDDLDRRAGGRGEILGDNEVVPSTAEVLRRLAADGQVAPGALTQAAARRVRRLGVPADAFAGLDHMRVTDVETFLRCPYGWLVGRYLAPRELERPFDPAAEGTLAHAVMQELSTAMQQRGVGACTPTTLPAYTEELATALQGVADRMRPRRAGPAYDAFIRRLDVHLRLLLMREAQLMPRMRPLAFERQLVSDDVLDAHPPIRLSGTADRIDADDEGNLVVIDYKRRGAKLRATGDVLERLQLPLYGHMAALASGPGTRPAGGFYVGVLTDERSGAVREDVDYADGVPPGQRLPVDEWQRMVDEALQAARQVAADVRAGRLAGPPTAGCPPWCGCGVLWR